MSMIKPETNSGIIYENNYKKQATLLSVAASFLLILIGAFFVVYSFTHYAKPVNGISMQPTINESWSFNQEDSSKYDIVVINRYQTAQRNDIIIVDVSEYFGTPKLLIKRLIAVGGDKLSITWDETKNECVVRVNDKILDEEYLDNNNWKSKADDFNNYKSSTSWIINKEGLKLEILDDEYGSIIIPDGYFFAMGDNRNVSDDCCNFGPLPNSSCIGVVEYILPRGNIFNTFFNWVADLKDQQA